LGLGFSFRVRVRVRVSSPEMGRGPQRRGG
jgi:hypothetical protein